MERIFVEMNSVGIIQRQSGILQLGAALQKKRDHPLSSGNADCADIDQNGLQKLCCAVEKHRWDKAYK
jgi:hypothetical protein